MMPSGDGEVLGSSAFRVRIGNREIGFCEVGPLTSMTRIDASPETEPPKERRWEPVVLRRAVAGKELFRWRQRVIDGRRDRRRVVIEQYDASGQSLANAWTLVDAWPCRWSGPAFNALETAVACEELELEYAELHWTHPPDRKTRRRKKAED